ncbi:MAG: hypothetical protein ACK6DP_00850 [Gemmatimonas sp.]|uniref:hypothetical protein n=1 Tax=Gemmatimonas sp. TaxID=1962908 RepID=UPI00391EFA80
MSRARPTLYAGLALALAYDAQRVIRLAPEAAGLFGGITLAFHELGHVLWSPLGEWFAVAGGSLTQLVVPIAACLVLRRQKDELGAVMPLFWLASSLGNLAAYIADARTLDLPLVSIGDGEEVIHDWNYLLAHAGGLPRDAQMAAWCRMVAWLVLGAALVLFARQWRQEMRRP